MTDVLSLQYPEQKKPTRNNQTTTTTKPVSHLQHKSAMTRKQFTQHPNQINKFKSARMSR